MKIKRNYSIIFGIVLLFAAGIYYSGCSSAETTTGKLAFAQKDYAKAEVELKKGLQIDRNDDEAWYMLGVSQIELGKYSDAQESFKRSLSISRNFATEINNYWITKYNAGINNFNAGLDSKQAQNEAAAMSSFRTALNNFIAASRIIPDSIVSYQLIGDTYIQLGKNDSALMVFNTILDKSKSADDAIAIAKILYESGIVAMNNKNYDRAIEIFGKVRTLNYLPHDNQFYEIALYNSALAQYRIVESMLEANPNYDFKPALREIVTALEELERTSKNNDLLRDSYDLLIVAYDGLDMPDKRADAERKKAALGN
jgi:tetratricopeptide (TPR) repeat protein